jgi:hypothetical protein
MSAFDLLILLPSSPEIEAERYLKASALLSYPEDYLKARAVLERPVDIYMRFVPKLQVETGKYLKAIPTLQREVFPYLKFAVAFPEAPQRYLKAASSMQARGDQYIRSFAQFVIHADYVKVRVALSKDPIFIDLGNSAPANKMGLLSRQYLSVASVKKEV